MFRMQVVLAVAWVCGAAATFIWFGSDSVASCATDECVNSACWKLQTDSALINEYDLAQAYDARSNSGGGTRTKITPEIAIDRNRTRTGTVECPTVNKGRSSCAGTPSGWTTGDFGKKHYCKFGT